MNQTTFDMSTETAKSDAMQAKRQAANTLKRDTSRVNGALQDMGNYHDGVPLGVVSDILTHWGFDPLEDMLLCGRQGSLNEPVGRNRWLSLTWYKMESGRYEVVSYVS